MGDRGRRILGDSLAGSWETLIRHRFGSHVIQSWIRLGADTLNREETISAKEEIKGEEGEIPTIKDLFLGLLTSLRPVLPTLLTHPHASPPLRLLFLVLSPNKALPDLTGDTSGGIRSKKSGKYRKNHAVEGKGFLGDEGRESEGKGKGREAQATSGRRNVSEELVQLGREIRGELISGVSEGEWRIIGVDAVGSPIVQVCFSLLGSAERGDTNRPAFTPTGKRGSTVRTRRLVTRQADRRSRSRHM